MASSTSQHDIRSFVKLVIRGPRTVGFPTPRQVQGAITDLVLDNELGQARQLAAEGVFAYPEDEGVLVAARRVAVQCHDTRRAAWLMDRLISIQRATALTHASSATGARTRYEGKYSPADRQAPAMRAE